MLKQKIRAKSARCCRRLSCEQFSVPVAADGSDGLFDLKGQSRADGSRNLGGGDATKDLKIGSNIYTEQHEDHAEDRRGRLMQQACTAAIAGKAAVSAASDAAVQRAQRIGFVQVQQFRQERWLCRGWPATSLPATVASAGTAGTAGSGPRNVLVPPGSDWLNSAVGAASLARFGWQLVTTQEARVNASALRDAETAVVVEVRAAAAIAVAAAEVEAIAEAVAEEAAEPVSEDSDETTILLRAMLQMYASTPGLWAGPDVRPQIASSVLEVAITDVGVGSEVRIVPACAPTGSFEEETELNAGVHGQQQDWGWLLDMREQSCRRRLCMQIAHHRIDRKSAFAPESSVNEWGTRTQEAFAEPMHWTKGYTGRLETLNRTAVKQLSGEENAMDDEECAVGTGRKQSRRASETLEGADVLKTLLVVKAARSGEVGVDDDDDDEEEDDDESQSSEEEEEDEDDDEEEDEDEEGNGNSGEDSARETETEMASSNVNASTIIQGDSQSSEAAAAAAVAAMAAQEANSDGMDADADLDWVDANASLDSKDDASAAIPRSRSSSFAGVAGRWMKGAAKTAVRGVAKGAKGVVVAASTAEKGVRGVAKGALELAEKV